MTGRILFEEIIRGTWTLAGPTKFSSSSPVA